MEKRILTVESVKRLGQALEDYFAPKGGQYVIKHARSVEEALRVVVSSQIDLVAADHQGPGPLDGLRLCREIRERNFPLRIILSADQPFGRDRIEALTHGCDSFFVKPHSKEKLAELIYKMLLHEQGFSGRVVGMRLEDVIQMFCFRKDSTLLTVSNGDLRGSIFVHEGGIVHAQCDSVSGVEAFYDILGWESGEFLSQVVFEVPARSVFMDWQSLLMEGIRQKDEIRHALSPATAVPYKPDDAAGDEDFVVLHTGLKAGVAPADEVWQERRIMIVDDSRLIRKIVHEIVQSDPGLNVVGYATNGEEALAKIDELKPHLILLDWDMPVMKGSTALMHIMIRSPCPVIVLSGFVGGVGASPFDLLCLGAVDFLRKPQSKWRTDGRADDLVRRIKHACTIKFERIRRVKIPATIKDLSAKTKASRPSTSLAVFGSSTGGCSDLIRIIPSIQEGFTGAAIFLHDMQLDAIGAFIEYLDGRSQVKVLQAQPGATLMDGVCYVHPSVVPLELVRDGDRLTLKSLSDVPDHGALDHFLISASKIVRRNLLAVLLSGGPDQGVQGLRAVKQVEGVTVAQDPDSAVDPRMAEAALEEGLVDHTYSADTLANVFSDLIRNR